MSEINDACPGVMIERFIREHVIWTIDKWYLSTQNIVRSQYFIQPTGGQIAGMRWSMDNHMTLIEGFLNNGMNSFIKFLVSGSIL